MDQAYFQDKTAGIKQTLTGYLATGKRVFVGSSFQTHSIPLLHIVSSISQEIPVYFIDTGFHFPETIRFKGQIGVLLGLNIIDTHSAICNSMQYDASGTFYHTSNPDHCCYLNKIQPLEPILIDHDVWINGIRRDQSKTRREMARETEGPFNTLRYHPMLDWTSKEIFYYRKLHQLPNHPLEEKGYFSIGCKPCTRKVDPLGDERSGRWYGMKKTECGLHTNLVGR
ncbi:MAG: phosphoadenylyl-sulfate reductase [Gammaproteobacteria bacterium]|nr:phosphoadenylyl-sulfate reductase [Gammaproteobacteria bacterium]